MAISIRGFVSISPNLDRYVIKSSFKILWKQFLLIDSDMHVSAYEDKKGEHEAVLIFSYSKNTQTDLDLLHLRTKSILVEEKYDTIPAFMLLLCLFYIFCLLQKMVVVFRHAPVKLLKLHPHPDLFLKAILDHFDTLFYSQKTYFFCKKCE